MTRRDDLVTSDGSGTHLWINRTAERPSDGGRAGEEFRDLPGLAESLA
jgi:hypothetical protein